MARLAGQPQHPRLTPNQAPTGRTPATTRNSGLTTAKKRIARRNSPDYLDTSLRRRHRPESVAACRGQIGLARHWPPLAGSTNAVPSHLITAINYVNAVGRSGSRCRLTAKTQQEQVLAQETHDNLGRLDSDRVRRCLNPAFVSSKSRSVDHVRINDRSQQPGTAAQQF